MWGESSCRRQKTRDFQRGERAGSKQPGDKASGLPSTNCDMQPIQEEDAEPSAASEVQRHGVWVCIVIIVWSGLEEKVKLTKPQGPSVGPFFQASCRNKRERNSYVFTNGQVWIWPACWHFTGLALYVTWVLCWQLAAQR